MGCLSNRSWQATAVLVCLLTAVLSTSIPALATSKADLVSMFDALAAGSAERFVNDKDSYAWGESYVMRAYAAMYEAVHDINYLRTLRNHIAIVFSQRDDNMQQQDYLGQINKAWGTRKYSTKENRHYVWAIHTGMITYPIAIFIRLVYEDPALWNEFKSDADYFLAGVIEAVSVHEKDWVDGPGGNEGHYTFGAAAKDVGINIATLPFNQQNALGCTFTELYRITGSDTYYKRIEKLAWFTKNRLLLLSNNSYAWMYWMDARLHYAGPTEIDAYNASRLIDSVEDTSHAAITVDFMVAAYRSGLVFQEEDMQRLINTVTQNVLTGDGGARMRIAGGTKTDPAYTQQVGRWGELGEFDSSLAEKLLQVYPGRIAPLVALGIIAKWLPQ